MTSESALDAQEMPLKCIAEEPKIDTLKAGRQSGVRPQVTLPKCYFKLHLHYVTREFGQKDVHKSVVLCAYIFSKLLAKNIGCSTYCK